MKLSEILQLDGRTKLILAPTSPASESVTLPCGHDIEQDELFRLAATVQGQRSRGISRGPRKGTASGRKPKLAPCPNCGQFFGVVAMRRHKNACPVVEHSIRELNSMLDRWSADGRNAHQDFC